MRLAVIDPDQHSPRGHLLVIGYGNELRSDDGVGPRVAATVAALNLRRVRVIACHQLTPELAEPVSQATGAVFVDASIDATSDPELRQLEPAQAGQIMAHAADPSTLLALARDLYGHAPPAWWLTIPVENLGFGETLSPVAQRGLTLAVAEIQKLSARV